MYAQYKLDNETPSKMMHFHNPVYQRNSTSESLYDEF